MQRPESCRPGHDHRGRLDESLVFPNRRAVLKLAGVRLAVGYERLAGVMGAVSLVRSMVSKEGDHERGTYYVKTGYRPDATVEHPSIGAVCCHELPVGKTE